MDKTIIEYNIPIQDKNHIDKYYEMCKKLLGDDFELPEKYLTTQEHIDVLFDKLFEAITKLGDKNGWYIGDGIKVKIELEYKPESK
jgi:hypothetical protein